jgi:hypothetical protein
MAVLALGCAHKAAEEPPKGSLLEDIYTKVNTEMDLEALSYTMPPYLDYLDNQVLEASEDPLLCRVSGAFYGHAFCFVEDTDKNAAKVLYLKGRAYVMKELKRYRRFDEAITFNKPIEQFRESLPGSFNNKNLPVLYWTALNWAGWINLNLDKPEAVADIPKVEAMLEFINSLDMTSTNKAARMQCWGRCMQTGPRRTAAARRRQKRSSTRPLPALKTGSLPTMSCLPGITRHRSRTGSCSGKPLPRSPRHRRIRMRTWPF